MTTTRTSLAPSVLLTAGLFLSGCGSDPSHAKETAGSLPASREHSASPPQRRDCAGDFGEQTAVQILAPVKKRTATADAAAQVRSDGDLYCLGVIYNPEWWGNGDREADIQYRTGGGPWKWLSEGVDGTSDWTALPVTGGCT